jgi:hypothetical protein
MKSKVIILITLIFFRCNQYRADTGLLDYGYSDYRLKENRFSVTYRGHSALPPHRVQEFALRRSAELCLKNGYRFFEVVSTKESTKTKLEVESSSQSAITPYMRHQSSSHLEVNNREIPSITLMIDCYSENTTDKELIDAHLFLSQAAD